MGTVAPGVTTDGPGRRAGLLLAAICVAALALRMHRAGDPFAGLHGWNEAHYSIVARNWIAGAPLSEQVVWHGGRMYWVPPMFSYILYVAFALFGVSEAVARTVPTVFSMMSLVAVFLLSRRLFNWRVGLTAAALLAVNPYYTLFGRNVQTDAVFTSLSLVSLHLYLRSREAGSWRLLAASGTAGALAVFAKQPAAILIPMALWIEWSARGAPSRGSRARLAAFCIMCVSLVLPWAVGGALADGATFWRDVDGEAGRNGLFTPAQFVEFFRPMFPASLWPLVLAGVACAAWTRDRPSSVLLAWLGLHYLFVCAAHAEIYYCLPLIPPHAILAAAFLDGLGAWLGRAAGRRAAALACICALALMTWLSLAETRQLLSMQKYGRALADLPGVRLMLLSEDYLPPHAYYLGIPAGNVSRDPADLERVLGSSGEAACLFRVRDAVAGGGAHELVIDEGSRALFGACMASGRPAAILYDPFLVQRGSEAWRLGYLLVHAAPEGRT